MSNTLTDGVQEAWEAFKSSEPRISWQVWCRCGLLRGIKHKDPGIAPVATVPCAECGSIEVDVQEQTTGGTVDREHLHNSLIALDSSRAEVEALRAKLAEHVIKAGGN